MHFESPITAHSPDVNQFHIFSVFFLRSNFQERIMPFRNVTCQNNSSSFLFTYWAFLRSFWLRRIQKLKGFYERNTIRFLRHISRIEAMEKTIQYYCKLYLCVSKFSIICYIINRAITVKLNEKNYFQWPEERGKLNEHEWICVRRSTQIVEESYQWSSRYMRQVYWMLCGGIHYLRHWNRNLCFESAQVAHLLRESSYVFMILLLLRTILRIAVLFQ